MVGDSAERGDRLPVAAFVVLSGPGAAFDDDHVGGGVDVEVLPVDAERGVSVEAGRTEGPPLVGVSVVCVPARAELAHGQLREVTAAAAPDPVARHHLYAAG